MGQSDSCPITSELYSIIACNKRSCSEFLQLLNMGTVADMLPGIGDDSNRLIECVLEALCRKGTISTQDVTFAMAMNAVNMQLSEDADHSVSMRILKCIRRRESLQDCIDFVFSPGNFSFNRMSIHVDLDISGFYFEINQAPKIAFIELSFRINFRIICTEMIKISMLEEDEEKLLQIAKALSVGEYIFDDEDEIQIDRSKISIPLTFRVLFSN